MVGFDWDKIDAPLVIVATGIAFIIMYLIGTFAGVTALTKIGVPMTLLVMIASVVASVGLMKAVVAGKVAGGGMTIGLVSFGLMIFLAFFLMPEKLSQLYSLAELKMSAMAILPP